MHKYTNEYRTERRSVGKKTLTKTLRDKHKLCFAQQWFDFSVFGLTARTAFCAGSLTFLHLSAGDHYAFFFTLVSLACLQFNNYLHGLDHWTQTQMITNGTRMLIIWSPQKIPRCACKWMNVRAAQIWSFVQSCPSTKLWNGSTCFAYWLIISIGVS